MKKSVFLTIIVLVLVVVGLYSSAFIVKESEQVVLVQFGEVIRLVDEPGLSFKIPLIQEAKVFDKRWIEWDGDANQITTRDKRYIYIDVFARWRISDALVFIETLRDEVSAQGRLDDIIDNATRNVVANHHLIEVIRSTNREFVSDVDDSVSLGGTITAAKDLEPPAPDAPQEPEDSPLRDQADKDKAAEGKERDPGATASDEEAAGDDEATAASDADSAEAPPAETTDPAGTAPDMDSRMMSPGNNRRRNPYAIEVGRDKLTRLVLEKASAKAAELGIEIKDVQIKRINYIESVEAKVFDRMISERKRVAEAYRSEGQGRSAEILGQMEMEMQQIQSEAYRESQKVMGRADAKAAEIYAKAYNRNPEFYKFVKTLESYRETIDGNDWLILSTDADYVHHLQTMKGKRPE
jgi:regulator of protease activity HflC (stomatin/prohibitin superfamily)